MFPALNQVPAFFPDADIETVFTFLVYQCYALMRGKDSLSSLGLLMLCPKVLLRYPDQIALEFASIFLFHGSDGCSTLNG